MTWEPTPEQRAKWLANKRAAYAERKASFRCVYCNAGLAEERRGVTHVCVECEGVLDASRAKWNEKHPQRSGKKPRNAERDRAWRKADYERRKLSGRCVNVGCLSPASDDCNRCPEHREEQRRDALACYHRKQAAKRAARTEP